MEIPEIGSTEPTATPVKIQPKHGASTKPAGANNRADSIRAKKKQRRTAHKVALRRSHTNG